MKYVPLNVKQPTVNISSLFQTIEGNMETNMIVSEL